MNKVVFHKFSPNIYPTNIYIAVTNNQSAISDRFMYEDCKDIDDLPVNCDALCLSVVERDTNEFGELIVFRRKEYMTIPTMAHESFHCVANICNRLGISYKDDDNNEAFAYLMGYTMDCCNQVRTNKFKS